MEISPAFGCTGGRGRTSLPSANKISHRALHNTAVSSTCLSRGWEGRSRGGSVRARTSASPHSRPLRAAPLPHRLCIFLCEVSGGGARCLRTAQRAKDMHSALPRLACPGRDRGKNSNWGLPLPIPLSQQKNKAARRGCPELSGRQNPAERVCISMVPMLSAPLLSNRCHPGLHRCTA